MSGFRQYFDALFARITPPGDRVTDPRATFMESPEHQEWKKDGICVPMPNQASRYGGTACQRTPSTTDQTPLSEFSNTIVRALTPYSLETGRGSRWASYSGGRFNRANKACENMIPVMYHALTTTLNERDTSAIRAFLRDHIGYTEKREQTDRKAGNGLTCLRFILDNCSATDGMAFLFLADELQQKKPSDFPALGDFVYQHLQVLWGEGKAEKLLTAHKGMTSDRPEEERARNTAGVLRKHQTFGVALTSLVSIPEAPHVPAAALLASSTPAAEPRPAA